MCGIAGFINFDRHDPAEAETRLKRMTDIIAHRGPDAEGFFVDAHAALGHRRLSIIDIASGHPPMGTVDGQLQIVFNGEIYNFLEIRAELEMLGHCFTTHSDTEVILIAYREWGETCVERLNGMFAFAIWDAARRKLFMARDRVGKKPLYYAGNGQFVAFASEIKALIAGGFKTGDIDPEALDCYFTFGYVPSPRTIYKNVKKLRAAHVIAYDANGIRERRYWRLSFAHPRLTDFSKTVEEFEDLLDGAVKCRLMSEVPLGVFLSGGIDSSLVVSSMAKVMAGPVLSNSIGFEDKGFNELPLARAVAHHLKTEHREFIVKANALNIIEKLAWHFDEPFADSSAVPTWYVCQMARENVTVALSGDGGDESFGGYTFRYVPHMLESWIRGCLPALLRGPVFGTLGALYPASAKLPWPLRLKTIFENLALSDVEAFYRDLAWLRGDTRQRLYSGDFIASLKGFTPFETVRPYYAENDAVDPLSRSQCADIHFYMTDDVLVKVDRMSMAHALEVRSPLLDYRLIEFAARLPAQLKVGGGQGKVLLRKAAARRLPGDVLNQPKRGFSIPAAQWLRQELKSPVEQAIEEKNSLTAQFMNYREINRTWQEHQSGSRDHSVFLWGLMMLEMWGKNYQHSA